MRIRSPRGVWGSEARLSVQAIPRAMWGDNARRAVGAAEWDRLRRAVYRRAGWRCEVCGAAGELHCHEVWAFDEAGGVQRLVRLEANCARCHRVRHIGRSRRAGLGAEALAHLQAVNGWTSAQAERHVREALGQWRHRPLRRWRLDLTVLGARGEAAPAPPSGAPE